MKRFTSAKALAQKLRPLTTSPLKLVQDRDLRGIINLAAIKVCAYFCAVDYEEHCLHIIYTVGSRL